MKYVGIVVGIVSLLFLGRFAADTFYTRGAIYQNLETDWTVKIQKQSLKDVSLPLSLDTFTGREPGATAVLTRLIDVPPICSSVQCYLFFGEVGDLSKVFVNGNLVKSQGYAEGFKSLAKHHPLWVELPQDATPTAEIRLEIESLYGVGFGITKGPLFIGDYSAIRSYDRKLSLQSVTFPLMQALMLFILGLLALACWKLAKLDRSVYHYGIFALTESAFMVSFSFLPREYLAVSTASAIHFSLRALSDWALFESLNTLLPMNKNVGRTIRIGFGLAILWYLELYFKDATYPEFVFATQVDSVLIVAVPAVALLAALYYWSQNKALPSPRYLNLSTLIPTLVLLSLFQLHDTSVFWGLFSGTYWVKFYLAPLALVLAIVIALRHIYHYEAFKRSAAETKKDAILGRIAMEFSHDLKSPLGSLRDWSLMALEKNDPEFTKTVLQNVASKSAFVTERLQELFSYAKDEIQERKATSLKQFVEDIHTDVKAKLNEKGIQLKIDIPDTQVVIDSSSFKRAAINLLENAIFASSEKSFITVSAKIVNRRLVFSVQDSGVGIDEKVLPQIFEPYFTTDKVNGTGLGLAIVDRITRQHGGHVQVFSKKDFGSTFVMEIPQ